MILRNSFSIFLSSVLLTTLIFCLNGQRKYKEMHLSHRFDNFYSVLHFAHQNIFLLRIHVEVK